MYPPQTRLQSCRIRVTLAGEYLPRTCRHAGCPCPRNPPPPPTTGVWAAECVWEASRIFWAFHSDRQDTAAVPPPCQGTENIT